MSKELENLPPHFDRLDSFSLGELESFQGIKTRALVKGKNICYCSIMPPAMIVNKLTGAIEAQRMPCHNACPFFQMLNFVDAEGNKTKGVKMQCTSNANPQFYPLT